ncbi:ABC transporter ATP-binding protein [Anaeromyxobacter dehalogenans]|uniref:ABC transporter, ATPase subunit n=1 Tax=Anaeromyxobacter dehalogenans (strain 2CP-C) TaxID=290397 RepID=Q2IG45_ANADE|nr:ABC transporter ATP-binding protein [Anaeromyxobacter dehalogenans]ABC83553.1 ABC transporter, ATPase subunit [Anaeromyxobacter dehalogenans 2CP-C]
MIRLAGVTKAFRDGDRPMPVLRGIDLEVRPGELVAIVGPSGSGKSTLLYVAGALDRDFAGEVEVAGTRLAGLSPRARAELRNRAVGFVFQSFNLLAGMSALENVMLPGMLRRDGAEGTAAVRARAAEALAAVGLAEKARATPAHLSGGERQRVAIARALLARPQVLLADEPTGNLDAASGDGIIRLFQRMAADGMTVLVVTHEERVSEAASRVLHLEDGRLR